MATDFEIVRKKTHPRPNRYQSTRFVLTRKSDDGRDAYWQLSPTALRKLADHVQDALDAFEAEESYAGNRLHDDSK
ncbi:hypothetical protein [Rhodococcus sp. BP22]|uniref:hypothetical protein n=1 Tax=Rhodococcus sp. BP22 TaxID=2758566 RepID=UPI001646A14C|nr:hypothetical protein [Rhodococcus sp. BP22]